MTRTLLGPRVPLLAHRDVAVGADPLAGLGQALLYAGAGAAVGVGVALYAGIAWYLVPIAGLGGAGAGVAVGNFLQSPPQK